VPSDPSLRHVAAVRLIDSFDISDFDIASPRRSGATYEPKASLVKDELIAKTLSEAAKVIFL